MFSKMAITLSEVYQKLMDYATAGIRTRVATLLHPVSGGAFCSSKKGPWQGRIIPLDHRRVTLLGKGSIEKLKVAYFKCFGKRCLPGTLICNNFMKQPQ
jgi:hypothetical protein